MEGTTKGSGGNSGDQPDRGRLPKLRADEHEKVVHRFTDTASVCLRDRLIQELFEEQVRRTPDAIGVTHEERQQTYAELNAGANQLARYLLNEGAGPDRLIGVCIERSVQMVISLLGILKAGCAYVPLDPDYPAERLQYMLEDAGPQMVLTEEHLRAALPMTRAKMIVLPAKLQEISGYRDENLSAAELGLRADNLAYVIYTSGSTGQPKGTAMSHRSMVNLIEWHRRSFCTRGLQRVLQFAALSFDVAFQEVFSTLSTGCSLVLPDEWIRRDVGALMRFLGSRRIQRLFVPPLVLQSLAAYFRSTGALPESLEDVITAGEQLRISPEISHFFKHLKGCRLHNHYGPTETHVVTALTLTGDPGDWSSLPPIGGPIANAQVYVLDEGGKPATVGVEGEIHIGGAGMARGYLRKPDLTAQRFLPDPFSADPHSRLYRTGDLGRWQPDGMLEFLGRNDEQVKIRGFRIELAEIGVQLMRHERVNRAAVIVREDVPGDRCLVAYVEPCQEHGATVAELRGHLRAVLPDYMVPAAFVLLERLPLTPNGKLDRRALPEPKGEAFVRRPYEPPQGEMEEILARLWQELLRVERVGRRDNFFELGGHSLLIVKMFERLRQAGLSATVQHAFESKTLADLASTLTSDVVSELSVPVNLIPPACEAITPQMLPLVELEPQQIEWIVRRVPGGASNIQDIYPLVALQEGILFHHLLAEHTDAYLLAIILTLSSHEKLDALIRALQEMIDRHDILRSAFLWEQLPRPVQVVYREAILPVQTLEMGCDPLERLKERTRPEWRRLDLQRAPLVKLEVALDADCGQCYALLKLHHLVCDHESLELLLMELMSSIEGRGERLPQPVAYRYHVAQALMHAHPRDAEAFFRSRFGDVVEPTVPFGLLDVHGDGSRIVNASKSLGAVLGRRIRAQARQLSVSTATLFHAAWGLVVSGTSGRDDVVYGSLVSGRLHGKAGSQRSLGIFINTLPVRLRLADITARDLVEGAHQGLAELLTHEQASLALAQRCSGIAGSAPLFTALLNYHHGTPHLGVAAGAMASGVQVLAIHEWTNYPVVLSVEDHSERFELTAQTDYLIDPSRIVDYMSTVLQSLLEALEIAPQTPALALSILPESERQQVVELCNKTRAEYPRDKLLHELFEEQVKRTPNALAVIGDERSLTYAELNGRANQLAHYLREQGVQIGEYILVLLPRSLQMVIAQLAVLKSGGVYVPMDPKMPKERQVFMVRDCGARWILTERYERSGWEEESIRWIECAQVAGRVGNLPRGDLKLRMQTPPPAYVMYTSGSTGVPKGVVVPHRAVSRLVINNGYAQIESTDCIAHCSNPTFDASTFEIWGALLNGARVLIVPQSDVLEAERFAQTLKKHGVTVLFQTTALFNQRAAVSPGAFAGLRYLLFGGEVSDPNVVRKFLGETLIPHLLHVYGPTETTTFATCYPIVSVDEDAKSLPIGVPISNTQLYILDGCLRPVPIGVAGEICIGGEGVALGYLNRPALTAERFLPDPFSTDLQARMYRTGDIGRWRSDGNIEFLGRNDHQVKIRGYRIELGEIEAQLARHVQVREAVVLAREDVAGEKRLVAYVVGLDVSGETTPSAEALSTYLKASLPEYMVPSAFVMLERQPLTPNGKLDRRALQAPELEAYVSRKYEAPQGYLEEVLAGIWQELLRVERVGRQDNFFELGGHSLLATRLMTRIRSSLAIEMPLSMLFEYPALKQLSAQLDSLAQRSLLDVLAAGDSEADELLERVASMPESEVREWVRVLQIGGRR